MSFRLTDYPVLLLLLLVAIFWCCTYAGMRIRKRRTLEEAQREELDLVLNGSLTLLALIIGFTFSMAVGRYDERKGDEAREANAIGTEYLRVGLLGASDGIVLRGMLKKYTAERIRWYTFRNLRHDAPSSDRQHALETGMWSRIEIAALRAPTPVRALVAAGMNEVIDTAGYTDAAWANRIPRTAWFMMFAIAISCCVLVGYNGRGDPKLVRGVYILPVMVAIALFLIADLDSTRGGVITVRPDNLVSLEPRL